MPQENCPHCGAGRAEDASFCVNCGAPAAAPPSGPERRGGRRGILIAGLVLLLLIGGAIVAAIVLGGDEDDERTADGSGSEEEFCEIWRDFDATNLGSSADLTELRALVDRMRATGAPDDIPDDAQQGIDALLRIVDESDSVEKVDENFRAFSAEDQRNVMAAVTYAEGKCEAGADDADGGPGMDEAPPGTEESGTPGEESAPPGEDGGAGDSGSTSGAVSLEQFCADMMRLMELDADDDFARGKAHLAGIAARGAPAEMPASAREGLETYLRLMATVSSSDDLDRLENEVDAEDVRKMETFMSYVQGTCLTTGASPELDE